MSSAGIMNRRKGTYRRAPRRVDGGLYESAKMFNRAFDLVFCEHRPWLRNDGLDPVFADGPAVSEQNYSVAEVVQRWLAMDPSFRRKGMLRAMVRRAGLNYDAVTAAIHKARVKLKGRAG